MQLFETSGIRRLADEGLIQLALKVGLAVSSVCGSAVVASIRVSGTEPKIRVTAEAKSEARVHQLCGSGVRVIKECIDTGEAR